MAEPFDALLNAIRRRYSHLYLAGLVRNMKKDKVVVSRDDLDFLLRIIDENMGITSKEDYVRYKKLRKALK